MPDDIDRDLDHLADAFRAGWRVAIQLWGPPPDGLDPDEHFGEGKPGEMYIVSDPDDPVAVSFADEIIKAHYEAGIPPDDEGRIADLIQLRRDLT